MKKNSNMIVIALLCSVFSLQAVTKERLATFLGATDTVALIQNVSHAAAAGFAWSDRWLNSMSIEDMAFITLLSQIPNDIVRSALECDRSWLVEVSQQALLLRAFEPVEDVAGAFVAKLIDTAIFNRLNQAINKKYPALDEQLKRRVLRIVGMTVVRLAMLALAHGIVAKTKQTSDFWGAETSDQDQRHSLANIFFGAVVMYHVLTECAGGLLARLIDGAVAHEKGAASFDAGLQVR